MHTHRPTALAFTRAAAVTALALAASACADSLRPLGANPAAAEAHANQIFEAFATRFSPLDLSPKYDRARVKLAEAALIPSRIFNDTSVWDARPSATSRAIYVSGSGTDDGKYRLETRPAPAAPARLGDTRHIITLDQLTAINESVYRWDARVDLGVGAVTAEEISKLVSAVFAAPDGRTARELTDDYRSAFPRARAAFGRGFVIDTLRASPSAGGATSVTLSASFHPELMQPAFPALAKYLDKYLAPAKYHFVLAERGAGGAMGAPLFEVVGRDRRLTLRYRVHQGKLTTLAGPLRGWSDTLLLAADVSLKVKLFTVGFHDLVTDFIISDAGHDRALTVVARREPKWDLPLFTESLIRSPLHRPFEGQGSMFRLSVRDGDGAQTLFSRRTRLDVQESTIMRFLGGLASHALGELDAKVEAEEDRFLREGFLALQSDLRVLVPRWR